MTGDPKCPACILKAGIRRIGQWPRTQTIVGKVCTGRPGCVRDPNPITPRDDTEGGR